MESYLNFEDNTFTMTQPMIYQTVLVDIDPRGVATVSLNRPDVRNALNPLLISELTKIITDLGASDDVRIITIKGEGKIFCAGADLGYMQEIATYSYDNNVQDALALAISSQQLIPVLNQPSALYKVVLMAAVLASWLRQI